MITLAEAGVATLLILSYFAMFYLGKAWGQEVEQEKRDQ